MSVLGTLFRSSVTSKNKQEACLDLVLAKAYLIVFLFSMAKETLEGRC